MAEQPNIPVPAPSYPGSSVEKERCGPQTSPTDSTFPFLELPKEIQYQIYEWAVGHRTLHIQHSNVWPEHEMPSRSGHVYCYVCHAQSTQFDVYDSYAKPVILKDKLGSAPRFKFDPGCRCLFRERAQHSMDLRLLTVSRETAREAQRLFYATNTWHFNRVDVFRAWLAVIPPEKLALVTRLHLVIHLHISNPRSNVFRWKTVLSERVNAQLPNLKVVHIELYVAEFALGLLIPPPPWMFSRQTMEGKIAELFQPLRRLEKLKECTVVMKEQEYYYAMRMNDTIWHGEDVDRREPRWKGTFWARKEAMRVWAEDIRSMVLGR